MKNDFILSVTTPISAGFSPRRISRVLKHLIQVGQLLCKHTIDDNNGDAAIEADALNLTVGVPKPVRQKPVRIAIFVNRGNVQDVYANVKGIGVTLVDHDNGEVDEATREKNEQVVESMGTEFPFNCF